MTQKQTEAMTQAEQIYDKYLIHIPDFINRNPRVIAAIQEALDIREKELEALREERDKEWLYEDTIKIWKAKAEELNAENERLKKERDDAYQQGMNQGGNSF